MSLNIVLVNPQIPQNTGNIARTCAATGATLHLIKPLGFSLDDRYMKRAGLDYWFLMHYIVYDSLDDFLQQHQNDRLFFTSSKGPRSYTQIAFQDNDYLVFGCESRGLNEKLLEKKYEQCIRIPMRAEARSLNLSNSVAIVLYEALRQLDFTNLNATGCLSGRDEPDMPWIDYL